MVTAAIHHRAIAGNATRTGLARLMADGRLDAPKVTQYVWDQSYIDTPILRYQDANGDGDTADAGDSVLYYTTDANHNITGLVGQVLNEQTQSLEWKVVERYVYDAYGKVTICHGNDGSGTDWSPILAGGAPVSASPLGNEILYCGYHYDSETAITTATLTGAFGSYQVCNREYNVLLSQWTTQDPMGYAAGDANLRRYCGNRPVAATDPSGLLNLVNHVAVTAKALGRMGNESPVFDEQYRMSFYKGACNPDLMFLGVADREKFLAMAVDAKLAVKGLTDKVDHEIKPITDGIWTVKKWAVWTASPQAYRGLRWARNWWQDSDFITEPTVGLAARYNSDAEKLYQTHFGNMAWQHSMFVPGLPAAEIRDKLVKKTAELIESARKNEKCNGDQAAFDLGYALHLLHDSWTESHATRNSDGQLTRFQDYRAQSPTLHAGGLGGDYPDGDVLNQEEAPFDAHVDRSVALLKVFLDCELTGEKLKNHLRENFYQMSDKAEAAEGAIDTRFGPRNKKILTYKKGDLEERIRSSQPLTPFIPFPRP